MDNQGSFDEDLKDREEHEKQPSLEHSSHDGQTMETSKREHRRYRCHSNGSSGLDEPIFPNSSMSMTDSDKKVSATTFPQQVPWHNTNEARQDGRSLDDMEEEGLKNPNVLSASVQDASALPVGNGASDLSTEVRHNDKCANGTTNSTSQSPQIDNGHGNTVQSTSGDRRMVSSSRGSDVGPGAAALGSQGRRCPGISEESRSQEHRPGAFAVPGIDGDRGTEDQVTVVADEESMVPISAQAVDTEQESRILQENFRLRQMVDNAVIASPASQAPMCPYCRKQTSTRTRHQIGWGNPCMNIICCALFWPSFLVPLLCHGCKMSIGNDNLSFAFQCGIKPALYCNECNQRIE